ncbi:MAG: hypothetical protein DMG13_16525 [Acidobacteria bacterium]|nr:MAG: hypothetical protein DMG13_16525 [Acidobacteriota bacterium]
MVVRNKLRDSLSSTNPRPKKIMPSLFQEIGAKNVDDRLQMERGLFVKEVAAQIRVTDEMICLCETLSSVFRSIFESCSVIVI